MPISLPPISRRRFLAGSVAAGVALLGRQYSFGMAVEPDPHRIALLSDIHIAAEGTPNIHGTLMTDHLRQACAEILKLDQAPAMTLVNGDCAYNHGDPADYEYLLSIVRPLRQAGIPMHLAMGNHDKREHFWSVLPADPSRARDLPDRQVLVVETPRANWVMLDSLDKTNSTPGTVGAAQLRWLAEALDARASKPAIVMVHHDPQTRSAIATHPTSRSATQPAKVTGLTDTKELLEVLLPRKQVKALLFGHTHAWSVRQREGLHMINLPAVAYVFNPFQPSGWVDAYVRDNGMSLELRCLDPKHQWHGEKHELQWRQ
jgi:3',5'-cyclic AMP phosphodiesterase CpdA